MKKIYLAVPYSGIQSSSYAQATKMTALIMTTIHETNVFSPITHSHPLASKYGMKGDWEFWQKIDYQFIDWADEIWVLIPEEGIDSVLNSIGVMAEIKYAKQTKKPIRYIYELAGQIKSLDELINNKVA